MANIAHITNRIAFASAGAVRAKRPTVSPIRSAFSELIIALGDNPPATIIGDADAADLDELAEHMQRVMEAVEKYANAVLADAKHRTSGLDLDVDVTGILSDTRGDLVGTLKIAAERWREDNGQFGVGA
jgi:hypothetical protein